MSGVPNRLQPDSPLSDNLAYINDNFDKLVTSIASFGGRSTTVATGNVVLGAGAATTISVGITDTSGTSQYAQGIVAVPRLEVFVDTDNTDSLTWGFGSGLTVGQANAQISVHMNRRPSTGNIGVGIINIKNNDSGSHTYYYHLDFQYFAATLAGGSGNFF